MAVAVVSPRHPRGRLQPGLADRLGLSWGRDGLLATEDTSEHPGRCAACHVATDRGSLDSVVLVPDLSTTHTWRVRFSARLRVS